MCSVRGVGLAAVITGSIAFGQASRPSDDRANPTWRAALEVNREEVGVGVYWMHAQFDVLFGRPQSLNVLEVAAPSPSGTPRIDIVQADGRELTSDLGRDRKALAAVNGGFFSIDGAPEGYLKDDGVFVHARHADRPGGLVVDGAGRASIRDLPAVDSEEFHEALGCGPMLLRDSNVIGRGERSRTILHPRTGVGLRPNGDIVFVVADGRTKFAGGLNLEEFGAIFQGLGCTTALNLDGGGSSTLWIRGRDASGVVNYPSDNKEFDHGGERAVGNAVLVRAPAVAVVDDSAADVVGESRKPMGRGHAEGATWFADGGSARATWSTRLPRGVTAWSVLGWWPAAPDTQDSPRARISIGEWAAEFDQERAEAGRWVPLGTIQDEDGAVVIVLEGCAGKPLVVDAFRFVQA